MNREDMTSMENAFRVVEGGELEHKVDAEFENRLLEQLSNCRRIHSFAREAFHLLQIFPLLIGRVVEMHDVQFHGSLENRLRPILIDLQAGLAEPDSDKGALFKAAHKKFYKQ